jgi:hypothetical protein
MLTQPSLAGTGPELGNKELIFLLTKFINFTSMKTIFFFVPPPSLGYFWGKYDITVNALEQEVKQRLVNN